MLVLEFSRPWKPLARAYDAYSFQVLPRLGRYIARDEAAYRYLAESIRMHPGQEVLQVGKREVNIDAIEPVGVYAVKLVFSDMRS